MQPSAVRPPLRCGMGLPSLSRATSVDVPGARFIVHVLHNDGRADGRFLVLFVD